jgi:hypothetical protein
MLLARHLDPQACNASARLFQHFPPHYYLHIASLLSPRFQIFTPPPTKTIAHASGCTVRTRNQPQLQTRMRLVSTWLPRPRGFVGYLRLGSILPSPCASIHAGEH